MIVRNAVGQVTVQRNKITCTAGGAGIWMFGNAVPVVVTGQHAAGLRQRRRDTRSGDGYLHVR